MLVLVLLLFATSGAVMTRMTCLMSGQSQWSLGLMEDCCPENEELPEGPAIGALCCVMEQAAAPDATFLNHAGPEVPALLFLQGDMPQVHVLLPEARPIVWPTGRPPPAGTERLALLGTLLI
jgi:hypothetical protein